MRLEFQLGKVNRSWKASSKSFDFELSVFIGNLQLQPHHSNCSKTCQLQRNFPTSLGTFQHKPKLSSFRLSSCSSFQLPFPTTRNQPNARCFRPIYETILINIHLSLFSSKLKSVVSREKYRAVQTVDIYQFISDLKINLGLSNNSKIYTISIFLNFDHVIIWMYAIDVLQVVLWENSFFSE